MKKIILLLLSFFILSCQNDFDEPSIQELLTSGSNPNIDTIEKISNQDTLYNYLNLVSRNTDTELTDIGCIEFIYPFLLFQFDNEDQFTNQVSVTGNENFVDILNNLQDGASIGLSYPISGNLIDGTLVTVNSNEELQESLQTCIESELEIILEECNSILTIENCTWKITESDNDESPYIESFFTIKDDGSVVFSVLQDAPTDMNNPEDENIEELIYNTFIGTWIFYYIGADLHLNINFGPILENEEQEDEIEDKELIKLDWNFDWKINFIDSNRIEIQKEYKGTNAENEDENEAITEIITLERECESDDIENNVADN